MTKNKKMKNQTFESFVSELLNLMSMKKEQIDVESFRGFYDDGQTAKEVFERELEYLS